MDAALARRCRGGDPAAFQRLVELTSQRTYRLAHRLTGNPHDALDVVQEAYTAVWRALPGLRDPEAFAGWFLQVVTRACRDWLRRQRRAPIPVHGPPEAVADRGPTPEEAAVLGDTQQAVRRAVGALPPDYAVTVALHYQEDLSYREISQVLGVSVRTVETRLRRAREMLRRKLHRLRPKGEVEPDDQAGVHPDPSRPQPLS